MLPLPMPEQGASVEALDSFLNLSNSNDFRGVGYSDWGI
jgi:hypothetical protein